MLGKSQIVLVSSLLLLVTLPVIRADLMCYVCDDCAQLPKDAPLLACNEDFFNSGGSTEASTDTTTTTTEPTTVATEESTTTVVDTTTTATSAETSTSEAVETTSSEITSETTQSTESTEAPSPTPPTPPTAGPVETTPAEPTPPAEDLSNVALNITRLAPVNPESSTQSLSVESTSASNADSTTSRPGDSTPAVVVASRRRRDAMDAEYTYHCYSVNVAANGSVITNRGCSRVTTFEAVCDQLKMQNNDTELASCDPCSMNACNSSSMLRNSVLATFLLAFVAAALQRN
ncbi:uncharacterized protein Dana_GF14639 [Drosophila ananassae]|uniref:DUF753 domain-containing protein n=1 Tax=Drosophila ananassae TaxID=7217 RepID=B3MPF5_DROAN|nr:flocculation protein FLO11 [Drosophila ananassae]EDV31251.1 uncharacterized protein Dana_GF14639 [Drosophila ananassae]